MDIEINTFTARPALELLLAARGFESPLLPFKESWTAFKEYLKLPASATDDQASFQTERMPDADTPMFAVRAVRQITTDDETRAVALEFLFANPPAHVEEISIWARDYGQLQSFFDAVQHADEFEYALDKTPESGSVVEEEPER